MIPDRVSRQLMMIASLAAFLAVALGAFGAHGLKARISEHDMVIYQTAVTYHMWHALGLGWLALISAFLGDKAPGKPGLHRAGWLFLVGIVLFSGSLYLLSVTGMRWLGMITPFGGLAFLAGWLLAFMSIAKTSS